MTRPESKKKTISSTTTLHGDGEPALTDSNRTMLILFSKDGKNYRMRVARVHVHPGERDRIEVEGKTMLEEPNWTDMPDGTTKVPSPEWLVRRALWRVFSDGLKVTDGKLMTISLGEI